jgi:Family of unknown function (DUF5995)
MLDTVRAMDELVARWGEADQRTIFVRAYREMTSSMLEAIEAAEFEDAQWVKRLLERFAEYYFESVALYASDPDRCPVVWRVAFDATVEGALSPLRTLFLGINAHINYDLALCVSDVMDDWVHLDDFTRALRQRDYERVNSVIRRTVDAVQRDVVEPISPALGVADLLMGPLDEWLFSALIADWRHDTWDDALAVLEAPPNLVDQVRARIEERALATADRVIHIGPDRL